MLEWFWQAPGIYPSQTHPWQDGFQLHGKVQYFGAAMPILVTRWSNVSVASVNLANDLNWVLRSS